MNKKLKSRRKSMKKSRTKIRAGVYNELRKKLIDNGVPEIMVDKIIRDALLKHPVIKMFENETNRGRGSSKAKVSKVPKLKKTARGRSFFRDNP